ncbi:hypothetical protein Cha6605_4031 [Chamaesiphon minutus PCC 6605]|uniref:Uncharacterized protein n=1 Tax=Chamaesiphon minutus (strain ATCC 27169 / PCC 6605) TaxID=1173020 RepID=K9UJZ9_CHAP6|nr:hypothetical protein Cha6605_4031 [Chamaesiphon minutus PCC 6605]
MRSALNVPQIEPCAGEFEGRGAAPQRGVWGKPPPDPGSTTPEIEH